jgi:hypothetical protein
MDEERGSERSRQAYQRHKGERRAVLVATVIFRISNPFALLLSFSRNEH